MSFKLAALMVRCKLYDGLILCADNLKAGRNAPLWKCVNESRSGFLPNLVIWRNTTLKLNGQYVWEKEIRFVLFKLWGIPVLLLAFGAENVFLKKPATALPIVSLRESSS